MHHEGNKYLRGTTGNNRIKQDENMTVVIREKDAKNVREILNEKLQKNPQKGNLAKHFGKLQRNIDGLAYQQMMRKNED